MRRLLKYLIIILTFMFSIVCGLFLVQVSIPVYFKLFSPVSENLNNFYITVGVFSFLLLVLDVVFFKKGKYNWGIWILGTTILFLFFGIPLFMLENNNMLWHEAVFSKPGPVYFIEFSDEQLSTLKYFHNLYELIWNKVSLYVYLYIVIYLAGYLYLWKLGWRIRDVRIKF